MGTPTGLRRRCWRARTRRRAPYARLPRGGGRKSTAWLAWGGRWCNEVVSGRAWGFIQSSHPNTKAFELFFLSSLLWNVPFGGLLILVGSISTYADSILIYIAGPLAERLLVTKRVEPPRYFPPRNRTI